MHRQEAYEILTRELAEITELEVDELSLSRHSRELSVSGENCLYTVNIQVARKENGRYLVKGSIHSNNSYKFELMEEQIEIVFGDRGNA